VNQKALEISNSSSTPIQGHTKPGENPCSWYTKKLYKHLHNTGTVLSEKKKKI
jgi:hypothetical protein